MIRMSRINRTLLVTSSKGEINRTYFDIMTLLEVLEEYFLPTEDQGHFLQLICQQFDEGPLLLRYLSKTSVEVRLPISHRAVPRSPLNKKL